MFNFPWLWRKNQSPFKWGQRYMLAVKAKNIWRIVLSCLNHILLVARSSNSRLKYGGNHQTIVLPIDSDGLANVVLSKRSQALNPPQWLLFRHVLNTFRSHVYMWYCILSHRIGETRMWEAILASVICT